MSYIFLSYSDFLDKGASYKNEFYNISLNDQFKAIERRIPLDRQVNSLNSLIETCFPSGMIKKYYISCPNFLRELQSVQDGRITFLRNIVLRPELTLSMRSYLPDNQNLILIGDIFDNGKLKMLQVKGLQLIDASMSSPYDLEINGCSACHSFARNVWSINHVDWNDTYFTPNNVMNLIEHCWTVKDPAFVRKTYEQWKEYINFRKYYLEEQSKRSFYLDNAEYINAFAVNRKEYRQNASIYEDYLLDGRPEFSRGDMVVLSQKIEDAEEFPLIRLDIDRNKKAFNDAKILKRGKEVNEEERKIRSLSSDNVFITTMDPNGSSKYRDDNGNAKKVSFGELMNAGYALGDRFKIVSYDIEPTEHLMKLDSDYESNIDKAYKNIDAKYKNIIANEINDAVRSYEKILSQEINEKVTSKNKELNNSLERDILENKDEKILRNIDLLKSQIVTKIKNSNKQEKKESDADYQTRLKSLILKEQEKIDIEEFYKDRNAQILKDYIKELELEKNRTIELYKNNQTNSITNKYQDDIRNEKIATKEELETKLKQAKEKVIEEETLIRFSLYFRLGDSNNNISEKQIKTIKECDFIVYDNRAEQAKIKRQEQAISNFYAGYVKNPYLSTYLFNPEDLSKNVSNGFNSIGDINWYLESLNEKQKEAVFKAVSSNGLFLLQGPPGTGKTQVIAETVAQMVKRGKKVLISSETHKAIDNVFERLPKIAEIVPIRLIPSSNEKKKDNEYDPKFLVDNLYYNIAANMQKSVNRYKNFRKNKEEFLENYEKLQLAQAKINKSQDVLKKANEEIKEHELNAKSINTKISSLNDKKDSLRIEIDILRRTKRHIDNDNLRPDDDIKSDIILNYRKALEPLFDSTMFAIESFDLGQIVKNINALKNDEIERELAIINPESNKTILEIKKNDLKAELNKYVDELGDIINPSDKGIVDNIKSELRKVLNELKAEAVEASLDDLKLNKIFNYSYLAANLSSVTELLATIKEKMIEIKSKYNEVVYNNLVELEEKQDALNKEIENYKQQIRDINEKILDIQDRSDVKDVQEARFKLENDLIKFFKDFEISEPYRDVSEGLSIIKRKWEELENDFQAKEQENKEKIPMYEKIANYIVSEDVINEDRKDFTKELFESANVFGITCTSSDRFSSKNLESLNDYNIEDFDIKSVGIDVVIIDEVSKSSFIDLLIPILYGKTVILVGDHRQLPPMYEFAKLRDDDYEGLDETIINKEINKKFTDLYEESFFKTLFEKVPEEYKTMLVQQYRCHEHIMNVFNHFYQGELTLGFAGQNNNKKHNIKLLSNGRIIIEPDKHIYFVDCKKNETHEADSTSMYNTGEANVVVELIKKLNSYFRSHPEYEKLSIGIICTYGDQARKIKELLKSEKVKTDAFKTDVEKMIVSTVDDFQGDERDIIILSTVRNPEDPRRSNPGFILAYQRINVALSRARRLLIMVGNRKYLEDKGVIDLPDVYGRTDRDQKNFRVYERILETIERYGKVVEDIDILNDKEARING